MKVLLELLRTNSMKIIQICIYFSLFITCLNACDHQTFGRFSFYPTELYPSASIQDALSEIFTKKFRRQVAENPASLTNALIEAGFNKTYQYLPDELLSVVVVEHPTIPGYVLKFSVRSKKLEIYYKSRVTGACKSRGSLKMRVENARYLQNILDNEVSFSRYIKIPKKYIFYVDNFPIVIAEKISIHTPKNLNDMDFDQIATLLRFVELSRGIIDLYPKNIIFDGQYIYFIDTEKIPQRDIYAPLARSINPFIRAINPRYVPYVLTWFENLTKAAQKGDDVTQEEAATAA